jgi:hypothetical protein
MGENPDNVSKVEAEEAPPQAAPLADDDEEAEGVGEDELEAEGKEDE